jgi:hypothetical protein
MDSPRFIKSKAFIDLVQTQLSCVIRLSMLIEGLSTQPKAISDEHEADEAQEHHQVELLGTSRRCI